jgi:hypothetical protein
MLLMGVPFFLLPPLNFLSCGLQAGNEEVRRAKKKTKKKRRTEKNREEQQL